jgi:hypothetical protein
VIPADFTGYFAAAATAAGALIGLLFVAISLRPESILGDQAAPVGRAMSGSAFTALSNSFFVSLIALIPQASLGIEAAVLALLSLYNTIRLHRGLARPEAALHLLVLSLAAYLGQLVVGILLIISPHDASLVYDMAYLLIASFAAALGRAWALVQGRHVAARPEGSLPLVQVGDVRPAPRGSYHVRADAPRAGLEASRSRRAA